MQSFQIVALANLNLREGPGESFEIKNNVPGGYKMTALAIAKDGGGSKWYKTNIDNGWVKAVYVAQPNTVKNNTRLNSDENVAGSVLPFVSGGGFGGAVGSRIGDTVGSIVQGAMGAFGVLGAGITAFLGQAKSSQERILGRRIYGTPFQFIDSTDMRPKDGVLGLEFLNNIMTETPIFSVLPGIPNYLSEMNKDERTNFLKSLTDAANNVLSEANMEKLSNKEMDMKFFEFEPRCMEYITYVNVLCRMCAIFLGIGDRPVPGYGGASTAISGTTEIKTTYGKYNWFRWHLSNAYAGQASTGSDFTDVGSALRDAINGKLNIMDKAKQAVGSITDSLTNAVKDMGQFGGIITKDAQENSGQDAVMKDEDRSANQIQTNSLSPYYMDQYYIDFFVKPPSYSESFGNSTNQSQFAGLIQSAGSMAKELQFLAGGAMSLESGKFNDQVSGFKDNMEQMISNLSANETIKRTLSTLITGSTSVITGANLIFPEIWESSYYNRDFSLEITLATPYGDRESIFLEILVPLMHLLALVLPRQSTVNSYSAPFLVRCTVPGFFACDMGIVKDMTISKGGPSGDCWSRDGLPTEVTVTLNIGDLYNALSMNNYKTPKNMWNFLWNTALFDYVGVACGLNMRSSEYKKKIQLLTALTGTYSDDVYDYFWGSIAEQGAIARARVVGAKG